jgi:hypothetical protein
MSADKYNRLIVHLNISLPISLLRFERFITVAKKGFLSKKL